LNAGRGLKIGGAIHGKGHEVEAISPGTWAYVTSPEIAYDDDGFFADTKLFGFDVELLDEFFPEPGRLLDLGCGTGRHVVHFARKGFDVTGIDLSVYMINEASEKLRRERLTAELVHGDMLTLAGVAPGTFHYAICMFSTLGLVRGKGNRLRFMRAIHDRLCAGGLNLLFRGGRLWVLRNAFEAALGLCELGDKFVEYRGIQDMFLHTFTLAELRRLLARGGFDVLRQVCLNDTRNGELDPGVRWRRIRANGFVVLAKRI